MNGAFHIGGVGLVSQQRALDVIANNIANINTRSFKRAEVQFSEILATQMDPAHLAAGLEPPAEVAGVRTAIRYSMDEPGEIRETGRALDLAIDGAGYIELLGSGGQSLLWRGGSLQVGDDGLLETDGGIALRAMINVPLDVKDIAIDADGTVHAADLATGDAVELGRIMLVQLHDQSGIVHQDGGIYRVDDDGGLFETVPGEDGSGILVQGALEQSNVDLNSEMVQLLIVQRAYAANAQIVQAADQLMAIANSLRS